jgi:flagellar FliL protein
MAGLFGKKKQKPAGGLQVAADDVDDADLADVNEDSALELNQEALTPKSGSIFSGWVGIAISALAITSAAAGGGILFGVKTAQTIETTIAKRDAAATASADKPVITIKYSGDTIVKPLEAVVTNLASPSDTWVRLEASMVFKNGALENPEVTGAELRQDFLAYLRTVNIAQLEGPSALPHLLEDLNERAAVRTNGRVSELVVQALVIQ